jgi:hypothetical protein
MFWGPIEPAKPPYKNPISNQQLFLQPGWCSQLFRQRPLMASLVLYCRFSPDRARRFNLVTFFARTFVDAREMGSGA